MECQIMAIVVFLGVRNINFKWAMIESTTK